MRKVLHGQHLIASCTARRAPSERFLLQNIDPRRSYGTCSSGSSCWTSFADHTVVEGETLAGLSIRWSKSGLAASMFDINYCRYNITIQDIKLANKIWTNEGLWPGRTLRIPLIEVTRCHIPPCLAHVDCVVSRRPVPVWT